MTTLVPSFLDGSSSFLQVTRTIIKAWNGLNFGLIPSPSTEVAALERLKSQYCCDHSSSFIIDWIFFILADNEESHKIMDGFKIRKIGPGTAELAALECLGKFPYTSSGRNVVMTRAPSFLKRTSLFLQVTRPTIKTLDEFEFQAEPIPDCGVNCP